MSPPRLVHGATANNHGKTGLEKFECPSIGGMSVRICRDRFWLGPRSRDLEYADGLLFFGGCWFALCNQGTGTCMCL